MARYFFHVHDGESFADLQGTDLPNLEAARREAVRFSGALLADRPDQFWKADDWTMRVTDERDLTLFELRFLVTSSAATMNG